MTNKFYKIRRKTDGLYSCGGWKPRFTKKGKTWPTMGGLKNHLNMYADRKYDSAAGVAIYSLTKDWPYNDCEIVEFEAVASSRTDATQFGLDYVNDRTHRENR